jgi:hypothetical protein
MIVAIILTTWNYSKLSKEPFQWIVLLILFSIVVALHGLSHLGLEKIYNYNPIVDVIGESR